MRVVGVIQARMTSSRLPGKTLLPIHGRPMLMRVWDRLRLCRTLDDIVVATSLATSNDRLARICELEMGMTYERAASTDADVTTRLEMVAERSKADAIVRITPDCPLMDPDIVDKVVAIATGTGWNRLPVDYCSNVFPRSYPDGLDCEFITTECLKKLPDSEEPTRYIWEHPTEFRIASVANNEDLSRLNWTVNYAADLEFVRWAYGQLPAGFGWRDLLALKREPVHEFFKGRFP